MTDILIIEDNPELAGLLGDFLTKAQLTHQCAFSGEDGLALLAREPVRLVILDIMLPGIDGFTVCQSIRRSHSIPIIILSALTEKGDKLSGLALGADDYLEKPYDIELLLAKVRALLRRHDGTLSRQPVIEDGDLRIDVEARTVTRRSPSGSVRLELTAKEFDLLVFLIENKGNALRKQALMDAVWGHDSISEPATLTVHIKWLRDKIELNPRQPHHIITV
ncbi:MAG: response regulator transcription factor, partial [Coriobacteriales bacterium]|nr:response regulator transcription factor [Coriobacteriales bacterium]